MNELLDDFLVRMNSLTFLIILVTFQFSCFAVKFPPTGLSHDSAGPTARERC